MRDVNLIRKVAWSFHYTTGIPYEDLFSEACLAYCKSKTLYSKKQKIKRVTWSFIYMKRKLIDFCRKEQNYHRFIEKMEILPDHRAKDFHQPEWLETVKKDEYLSQILFVLTYKRYRDTLTPHKIKTLIKSELIEMGWEESEVKENFERIKHLIS